MVGVCIAISVVVAACGSTSGEVTSPTGIERPGAADPPPLGSDQTSCSAAKAEWAVGGLAGNDLLERARIAAGASTARFLTRGQPITTEYLGTRLNLEIDERRIVVAVRCG